MRAARRRLVLHAAVRRVARARAGTARPVTTFDGNAAQACVPSGLVRPISADAGHPEPSDAGVPYEGGGRSTGNIGPNGGTLSSAPLRSRRRHAPRELRRHLRLPDGDHHEDLPGHRGVQRRSRRSSIATGDYQFASSGIGEHGVSAARALHVGARRTTRASNSPRWATTSARARRSSNCGTGKTNGITANYTAFMNQLLRPIGKTLPYYFDQRQRDEQLVDREVRLHRGERVEQRRSRAGSRP